MIAWRILEYAIDGTDKHNKGNTMRKNLWIVIIVSINLMLLTPSGILAQYIDGYSVDWQPNGTLIAYISDGKLTLFDTVSAQNLDILPSVPDNLIKAVWSADGTRLAASDTHGIIYIWSVPDDYSTGELLAVLRDFDDPVTSLAWSATGQWLAGSRWDGIYTVMVWDTDTFQLVFQAKTGNTYNVSWSPKRNILAITTIGGTYSVNFDQIISSLPVNFSSFSAFVDIATEYIPQDDLPIHQSNASVPITWNPDGTRIATGDFNGTVHIFDVDRGAQVAKLLNDDIVTTLDWSSDGQYLAGFVRDSGVVVWETSTYRIVANFCTSSKHFGHKRC